MERTEVSVAIQPIGTVGRQGDAYWVELEERYRPGLAGLEGFSHLLIVWWGHLYDTPEARSMVTMEEPYKGGPERIGVFATRSPVRPNPILTSILPVLGIDAEAGHDRARAGPVDPHDALHRRGARLPDPRHQAVPALLGSHPGRGGSRLGRKLAKVARGVDDLRLVGGVQLLASAPARESRGCLAKGEKE